MASECGRGDCQTGARRVYLRDCLQTAQCLQSSTEMVVSDQTGMHASTSYNNQC